jgi:hypothetical protein
MVLEPLLVRTQEEKDLVAKERAKTNLSKLQHHHCDHSPVKGRAALRKEAMHDASSQGGFDADANLEDTRIEATRLSKNNQKLATKNQKLEAQVRIHRRFRSN